MLFKSEGQADKLTKHNIRSQVMLKIFLFYPYMNAFVWLSIHYLAHSMVYYSVAFSIYSNLSLISVESHNTFGNVNDQLQDSRKVLALKPGTKTMQTCIGIVKHWQQHASTAEQ